MKEIEAKTILTRTKNNWWFGMDYNMNLYRGCCQGCIYCDSRSACYRIPDFDTVAVKSNAIELLAKELPSKRQKGVIGTGAMSDPYNPFEQRRQITRQALELMGYHGFGVGIATKSDLIVRDADLLGQIGHKAPVIAQVTVTTADEALAKKLEPGAPSPQRRFEAIARLAGAGIFTGVLMMPLLPYLEDNEENIVAIATRARESGAKWIYPMMGMTLREGQREYYHQALDRLFPGMKERYVREYGNQYDCRAKKMRNLQRIFSQICQRYDILYDMKDIVAAYKGAANQQLTLF